MTPPLTTCRGKRDDIDEEDDQESYFRYMEENPTAGLINDDDDNIEYDEDGNAIIPDKKVGVVSLCVSWHGFVNMCLSNCNLFTHTQWSTEAEPEADMEDVLNVHRVYSSVMISVRTLV